MLKGLFGRILSTRFNAIRGNVLECEAVDFGLGIEFFIKLWTEAINMKLMHKTLTFHFQNKFLNYENMTHTWVCVPAIC